MTELEQTLKDLGENENTVSGTLRLSAPRSSSAFFLDDVLAKYCAAYPAINVEVMCDDSKVDLVTAGIDAAIRSQSLLERETHAVEVGPKLEMVLVASPAYLERAGRPAKPADLTGYDGIRFGFGRPDLLAPWSFTAGRKLSLIHI